jgi:NTP pyrophosphatase (non-canonical NTP hydrolase)
MKTIEELIPLIEDWANEKGLLKRENAPKQYLKFLEEVGETAHEILHENWDKAKIEFGDIAVTVIILAKQLGVKLIFKGDIHPLGFHFIQMTVKEDFIRYDTLRFVSSTCAKYGFKLEECLNLAWDKIKDRKGKTENGTFIKE